ncbi:MAG: CBS domain-containing protein [Saprospiraceae bacterium]
MMNLEVRSIMTKNPVVAHPSQSFDDVTKLMMEVQIQQLPVVENGKLIGMITSHDLWKTNMKGNTSELLVRDIMTTKVVKITPKDKVGTAAELFADNRFKFLPVVNLDNELKGVVSAFDIIRCAFKEEYAAPILYQDVFNT